ncbi:MAG: DUF512 domain-containing protein [Oscillospiraceae bacterium]|jgi:putative radical SAM enzyme (TIGR03279 family)
MSVKITDVVINSAAEKAGINPGDILLGVNDNEITDVLDYMFYIAEKKVRLDILRESSRLSFSIVKSEYDDIGIEFSSFLMDEKKSCCNKCIFCFIDQLPNGMRDTLYFKDDDSRLSFLHGNYITLTNLNDKDINRIIKMHLNVNISVHTTNPELRVKMMNNRFAGEKLKYLKMLADNNIMMNCQIVLCPGVNDGEELLRSMNDLASLYPAVTSVAVVPVGLSKFREGLYPLESFTKKTAGQALELIEKKQREFLKKYETRLIFPADEFYLKAERKIPDTAFYEEYPQYENGIGLIRALIDEFCDALKLAEYDNLPRSLSLATGCAAYDFLKKLVEKAKNKWHNLNCEVYAVKNNFFGENITVAGLITGRDLVNQLLGKPLGDTLLIPSVMLRGDSEVFLDDYTVTQVENELGVKIKAVKNDGFELLDAILGIEN